MKLLFHNDYLLPHQSHFPELTAKGTTSTMFSYYPDCPGEYRMREDLEATKTKLEYFRNRCKMLEQGEKEAGGENQQETEQRNGDQVDDGGQSWLVGDGGEREGGENQQETEQRNGDQVESKEKQNDSEEKQNDSGQSSLVGDGGEREGGENQQETEQRNGDQVESEEKQKDEQENWLDGGRGEKDDQVKQQNNNNTYDSGYEGTSGDGMSGEFREVLELVMDDGGDADKDLNLMSLDSEDNSMGLVVDNFDSDHNDSDVTSTNSNDVTSMNSNDEIRPGQDIELGEDWGGFKKPSQDDSKGAKSWAQLGIDSCHSFDKVSEDSSGSNHEEVASLDRMGVVEREDQDGVGVVRDGVGEVMEPGEEEGQDTIVCNLEPEGVGPQMADSVNEKGKGVVGDGVGECTGPKEDSSLVVNQQELGERVKGLCLEDKNDLVQRDTGDKGKEAKACRDQGEVEEGVGLSKMGEGVNEIGEDQGRVVHEEGEGLCSEKMEVESVEKEEGEGLCSEKMEVESVEKEEGEETGRAEEGVSLKEMGEGEVAEHETVCSDDIDSVKVDWVEKDEGEEAGRAEEGVNLNEMGEGGVAEELAPAVHELGEGLCSDNIDSVKVDSVKKQVEEEGVRAEEGVEVDKGARAKEEVEVEVKEGVEVEEGARAKEGVEVEVKEGVEVEVKEGAIQIERSHRQARKRKTYTKVEIWGDSAPKKVRITQEEEEDGEDQAICVIM